MFEQLITISDQRKRLEAVVKKQQSDFEDSIALQKAQLQDLISQENQLREEALLALEKENKNYEKVGDKIITRQIKKTLRVIDPQKLKDNLTTINPEDYGFDKNITTESFENTIVIKNKSIINNLVDAYEKVEGKLLDGVEIQETKFIQIK